LAPLTEIAPQWRHPVSGKTAASLLAALSQRSGESSQTIRKIDASKPSA
jgi:7,8-dihydro-6-hydroxymethylpterin-pyrophosphokinase